MDVLILFESVTGNTAFGVEVMRLTIEKLGHDCAVERYRETTPEKIAGYDLYCFATPVMSFAPMASAWAFMRALPAMDGAPAFIFSTRGGFAGKAHSIVARELRKHGLVVIGNHFLSCETSFPVLRSVFKRFTRPLNLPRKRSLLKLRNFTEDMVSKAHRMARGLPVDLPKYRLLPGLSLPLAFNAMHGGLRRALGRRSVDMDACDLCGVCATTCPTSAITIEETPVFAESCIGCWGCFNVCPRAAIRTSITGPSNYYGGIKNRQSRLRKIGLAPLD